MLQSLNGSKVDAGQIIRQATGSIHCIFGPSGRALLFNLLKTLHKNQGGQLNEVLLPGYTCYSVAAAAVKAGLKLRFYDLDPQTLNPEFNSLEANCTIRTLAVISQHLFGIPTNTSAIGKIAAEKGAYHIEDAAQGYGGRHHGKLLGTSGDFGIFSFGRGKSLPLGGGGALIAQKHNLDHLRSLFKITAGWNALAINMLTQIVANPCFYGIAEMLPLGLGQTIFDPCFKTGQVQRTLGKLLKFMMVLLPELNAHRQTIASIYRKNLAAECLISVPEGSTPVYPRFPLLAKKGPLPPELLSLGVRRLYPRALNQEPQINVHATNHEQRLNGSETLANTLVTLPTHHSINNRVAETIASKTNKWLRP